MNWWSRTGHKNRRKGTAKALIKTFAAPLAYLAIALTLITLPWV